MMNRILLYSALILLISSCSISEHLPDDTLLYRGVEVETSTDSLPAREEKALSAELKSLLRPRTNTRFLGIPFKLWMYNLAGETKKEKGLRFWLRTKVGEEPVFFDRVDMEYSLAVMLNSLENRGYLRASGTYDSTVNNRQVRVNYQLHTHEPFTLRNISFPSDSTAIARAIREMSTASLLRSKQPFNLDRIKTERKRIDAQLKEQGYFYFSPDYLLMQADTTVGNHQLDMKLVLKSDMPGGAALPYRIRSVKVFPNYTLDQSVADSTQLVGHGDYELYDPDETFRPDLFDRAMGFRPGDLYTLTAHNLALNRLVGLGSFRYVKNVFVPVDTLPGWLDAFYYLTPLPKKSIKLELTAKTNSADYYGAALNLNWSHRNLFRGAEQFQLQTYAGMDLQVSGQNRGFDIYRIGGEASLTWPRLITPFNMQPSGGFVPRTRATVGYELQDRRLLYTRLLFRTSFGYQWKNKEESEHQLMLTEISYSNPAYVSELYLSKMATDPSLAKVVQRELIFGPSYSFEYNTTSKVTRTNRIYSKSTVQTSGNLVGLLSGANAKAGNPVSVLGVPFSQYIKLEQELRYFRRLGYNSLLASRIITGFGIPWGNSTELPYVRQFFIGGTNSIRAFPARSIGPGTFRSAANDNNFLADESGDLKLEMNLEYRAKLFGFVHGALFVDAGNIWLLNQNADKPGAAISTNFMDELAVGVGAGLRFDFTILVLRVDLAVPVRKPYLPAGDRWVFNASETVFNLAIGYPF